MNKCYMILIMLILTACAEKVYSGHYILECNGRVVFKKAVDKYTYRIDRSDGLLSVIQVYGFTERAIEYYRLNAGETCSFFRTDD